MSIKNYESRFFSFLAGGILFLLLNVGNGILSLAWADSPGTWSETNSSMINPRTNHTATRLLNGKILYTGPSVSAEVYDPDTEQFISTAGPMNTSRYAATATLLRDGKVLITGGSEISGGSSTILASAELYDPETGFFTLLTNTMRSARTYHTATLLEDGKVLITGGQDATYKANDSAELYDPTAMNFTEIAARMQHARYDHTATLLKDGNVLIFGGRDINNNVLLEGEKYTGLGGSFTFSPINLALDAYEPRFSHTATLLHNGDVLITGGHNGSTYVNSAVLYDSSTATLVRIYDSLMEAKMYHTATLLPNGNVLIAGGEGINGSLSSADLYDPTTSAFTATDSMVGIRAFHTATLLLTGKVLVAGGYNYSTSNPTLSSAELYCPDCGVINSTGSFVSGPTDNEGRARHTATPLPDGNVLIAGGYNPTAGYYLNTAELYNPVTGVYTPINSVMPRARADHTATLLPDGRVLLIGGRNSTFPGGLASADVYDSTTQTFSFIGLAAKARYGHTATLHPDGKVTIIGGDNISPSSVEQFINGGFVWNANLQTKRRDHTATLLQDGFILIVGGTSNPPGTGNPPNGNPNTAELLQPGYAGTTSFTGPMSTNSNLIKHTATLLPDGKVLIAGGSSDHFNFSKSDHAEIYDPVAQGFTLTNHLHSSRAGHTATSLPNGKVLIVGGIDSESSAEIYDPTAGKFSYAGFLEKGRYEHTATFLANCKVLIAGGKYGGLYLKTSELYKTTVCGPEVCGPQIQSIVSSSGQEAATIKGLNFGSTQGTSTVTFNGINAGAATAWSDTEITVNIPVGATTGSVIVSVNGFPSNATTFNGCASDVSGQISINRGGFRYNRMTRHYVQQIALMNTSNTVIAGPISLALDNLTSNAILINKSGDTSCATPVSSYITVDVGADNVLSAGESSSVILEFVNPTNTAIGYTPRVLTGTTK